MESLINRAELLIQQGRYKEAEELLAELLQQSPNNSYILAMCSRVAIELGKSAKALELINTAIGISPNDDYLHYIKSNVSLHMNHYDEAENSLEEAINMNLGIAGYFALWASIKLMRKQYEKALELANKALELDPEDIQALNTRSTALLKLNRKEESFETIENALKEDPNNAHTHANMGWNLLEKGDHKKALEHFKEALSEDPNSGYAQAGMINAIKAKYLIFRWFLKYSFWIQNLTAKYQWGVIIGFYFAVRFMNSVARNNPTLYPYLNPIVILLTILAFSTWIINPLSNLFLRLNPYGKYLLNEREKMSSNLVGFSAALFLAGLISYALMGENKWIGLAAFGFAMMVPFSTMFSASRQKNALLYYALAMFVTGVIALAQIFTTGVLYNTFSNIFIIGFVAFQWISNAIIIKEDNR